jgi:6-phospho-beta-glucosidase
MRASTLERPASDAGAGGRDDPVKLTLLGAGVRTPLVLRGVAAGAASLGIDAIALHDPDPERLRVMAVLGRSALEDAGANVSLEAPGDAREALRDARFVFAAIRVGGEAARAADERAAIDAGVLGQETVGPVGLAMAMRTIPAMLEHARTIEEVAPDAFLVNFTNPVGIVTQAVTQHTSVRAVGICDTPLSLGRSLAAFVGVGVDELDLGYVGLNHLGWFTRVGTRDGDALATILDRFDALAAADPAWALFDPGLVRALGLLPNEYDVFYYERARTFDAIRRSGGTRGEQLLALNTRLWADLARLVDADHVPGAWAAWNAAMTERGATYFARERGADVETASRRRSDEVEAGGYEGMATSVMSAVATGASTTLILDVPNRGAIAELADDDVVEIPCRLEAGEVHPLPQDRLPEPARALIEPVKAYERLALEAGVTRSRSTALRALLCHPLVGSFETASRLVDAFDLGPS